jgi:SPP1 gp7 family putative phage head morphogenesis protein
MATKVRQRLPKPLFPKNAERKYFSVLNDGIQDFIKSYVNDILNANILKARFDSNIGHLDDALEDIEVKHQKIWAAFVSRFNTIAYDLADSVDKVNQDGYFKQIKAAFGKGGNKEAFNNSFAVQLLDKSNALSLEVEPFAKESALLIRGVGEQVSTRIQMATIEAVRQGKSPQQFKKEIQAITGYAEKRSAFIAVDQISKLNGNISKIRMKGNGLNTYVWNTSGDNKVRPEHKSKDNTVRTWEQDPIPGSEFRCRCTASINLDEVEKLYPDLGD